MSGPRAPGERPQDLDEDLPRVADPFQGRMVRLRAFRDEDVPRLNEMFGDPDVLAGLTVAFPQPVAGFREFVEASRGDASVAMFVIETFEGEAVGGCGLEGLNPRNRSATLGIWIGRPYWGRGFGTDAVLTLCRFGFRHLNLQRIELHVYAGNERGIRAYRRVGFQVEGTLRRAQFLGGRYVDVLVMGLLEEELAGATDDLGR